MSKTPKRNKTSLFLFSLFSCSGIQSCIKGCQKYPKGTRPVYSYFLSSAVAAYKAVSKDVKNTQKEQDQFIQQKKNRRAKRRAARKARKQAERAAQGDMTEVRDDEVNSDSDSSDDEEQKVLKAAENERVNYTLSDIVYGPKCT